MRRFWASSAALAAATAALVVAPAGVAAADEPTREVVTLHRELPGPPCAYGLLQSSFDLTRDITTFYEDGIPVRRIIHGYGTGSITNPLTGESLEAFVNRVFTQDLTNGLAGFSVAYNIRVPLPTGGTAIIGGGQIVFDGTGSVVATHGPDTSGEINQLCQALAP
jgi:hypothetical protein